mmetsp:Transcript_37672/g.62463  ORF Transcript_37672/g.62463 Transcript_37672/m.62463 type:complete len:241 (+) Transcript_37672:495-1217(+)
MGKLVKDLLRELRPLETILPRIPVPVQRDINARLEQHERTCVYCQKQKRQQASMPEEREPSSRQGGGGRRRGPMSDSGRGRDSYRDYDRPPPDSGYDRAGGRSPRRDRSPTRDYDRRRDRSPTRRAGDRDVDRGGRGAVLDRRRSRSRSRSTERDSKRRRSSRSRSRSAPRSPLRPASPDRFSAKPASSSASVDLKKLKEMYGVMDTKPATKGLSSANGKIGKLDTLGEETIVLGRRRPT